MKKILIVEDSQTMRLFIRMSLRHLPEISVSEATDGLDAIERMEKEGFDLIITDIHMPRMDGLGLIESLRAKMGIKTPIIVLSTESEEREMGRAILLGANSYATKPIMGNRLVGLVGDYLRLAA